MAKKKKPSRATRQCPDCGAAVEVEILKPASARVSLHGCPARACEYPGCRVTKLHELMVRFDDGAWYCPRHGLLLTAKTLLALHQVEGDVDWSGISAVIAEILPDVTRKVEAAERGVRGFDLASKEQ